MPLIDTVIEKDHQILVWKMNESLEELLKISKNINVTKFNSIRRQKEYLTTRILLAKVLPNIKISYNKYGAPEIKNNNFISISHSKEILAIIISKKQVGLDIEKISTKLVKLSSKFTCKKQHMPFSNEKATLIWCCKEAMYKWHQKGKINYITDIKVEKFIEKDKGSLVVSFKKKKFILRYKKIETHFLVYVCI